MITFDKPTPEGISDLAENAREVDLIEAYHQHGDATDFRTILRWSVAASEECVMVRSDGEPVALFGVTTAGEVWLIGTDRLREYSRPLMQHARAYVARWRARYGRLHNVIMATNVVSMRWLQRLGFTIHMERRFTAGSAPFYPFSMEAPNV